MNPGDERLRVILAAPFERGLEHGGSQRATALAERLEERGAEVTWMTLSPRPLSATAKVRALARRRPAAVSAYAPASDRLSADVVIVAHSYLAEAAAASPWRAPHVIDFHNLEWEHLADSAAFARGMRHAYLRLQSRLMRRYERRIVATRPLCLFTSEAELDWARAGGPEGDELMVVPSLLPRAALARAAQLADETAGEAAGPQLAYIGTVRFPPNYGALVDFLEGVWPAIREAVPGIRLSIAGDCSLESRRVLGSHPDVEALGFVDDVSPLLRQSAAVVMPISGKAGTSLRSLFYAAAGLHVIGTPAAFRGLTWRMGEIVESPEEWAAAVRAAVARPGEKGGLAAAREAVLAMHADGDPWDRLYSSLATVAEAGG